MGGFGSGRQGYYRAKRMVNHYRTIDIRKWYQQDVLIPGTSFTTKWIRDQEIVGSIGVLVTEKCVILSYRYRDHEQWKDMNYSVDLEWSFCNLGGKRPWFLCPARNCGRRVAILYDRSVFACRHCYHLTYPS